MSVATNCKGCGLTFTAANEDELADLVLAHITEAHGHAPSREQVLAVIRNRSAQDR